MATKTQNFRHEMERSRRHQAPPPERPRSPAGHPHNQAERAARSASVAYEAPSAGGRSRKSTRGSANRSKSESALHITAIVRSTSPSARASRGKKGGRS
jgi:hypothetical protein